MVELILGQVLWFAGDAMAEGQSAARHEPHGAVALEGGRIAAVGPAADLRARYPAAPVTDMGDRLLSAGFIDAHVHYPQTAIIASWGKRLIDWLNSYTFPEEMRFADPAYAAVVAGTYFDLALAHGTTSMCSYATIHPASVEAFFAEAQARGLRALTGRTCMDRDTAPEGLRDTAQAAYDESKALLEHWHGRDRLSYVITPRFSPTSTPDQLLALGSLWAEHPDCLMQTHLSEQVDEIAWVKSLYPQARDYLDTYETFGLLGENGVYGHAIHLEPREVARLREVGAGLAHCPTSNTFIGSGLFDTAGLAGAGLRVGLATDTGGGSNFSMLRTMAAAYEVAQLRGVALHPAQLWYLATTGAARLLRIEDRVGNLAPGMEADLIALDLASTPVIAQRVARAEDFWENLFPTIMMGDDRAIAAVWVAGERRV
ncbi:guanine deaminase [Rhodobacter sp. TJ_12]|uniref:guanine deaminase n=1 Tax=Rhodobacter sp. TJ_12 TaxID=2029399 RepID=UPI001CBB414F|nr:guanine deaminase [Rhodobacter sp. TJ_12]MBZ4022277.1 guanine deaminase [Rhodobacter sp. TJ_12]